MRMWILSIFALVLLFGCIEVETYHKQNSDGSAEITQTMDLSGYVDTMISMNQMNNGEELDLDELAESFDEACVNMTDEMDVECTANSEDWTITISGHIDAEDAFYEFEVKEEFLSKKYLLTVDELPDFGYNDDGQLGSGSITDPSNAEGISMLQSYGVEMTYVIEMPGEITSAEYGEIEGNTVTFDLLEMMEEEEEIFVTSEESAIPCVSGLVALFAVGIVLSSRRA